MTVAVIVEASGRVLRAELPAGVVPDALGPNCGDRTFTHAGTTLGGEELYVEHARLLDDVPRPPVRD